MVPPLSLAIIKPAGLDGKDRMPAVAVVAVLKNLGFPTKEISLDDEAPRLAFALILTCALKFALALTVMVSVDEDPRVTSLLKMAPMVFTVMVPPLLKVTAEVLLNVTVPLKVTLPLAPKEAV